MDILRLDKTTYRPDALVDGYESAIWTERYDVFGDFEIRTTKNIDYLRRTIPEGSLISLNDSREVMLVDKHAISRNDDGVAEDIVTGKSVTAFLKYRFVGAEVISSDTLTPQRYLLSRPNKDYAAIFIHDTTTHDRSSDVAFHPEHRVVPNSSVTDSTSTTGTSVVPVIQPGNVYDIVTGFIKADNFGLRSIRPPADFPTYHVEFSEATDPPEASTRVEVDDDQTLRFDIYQGYDRSAMQHATVQVIFDYLSGGLNDPSYLFSLENYRNVILVTLPPGVNEWIWSAGDVVDAPDGPRGFERREGFLDGSSWQVDPSQYANSLQMAIDRSRQALKDGSLRFFFDAEISPLTQFQYGDQYGLGDLVSLSAEYGLLQTMRVQEYIRTEDASGDRGYPTLVTPDLVQTPSIMS